MSAPGGPGDGQRDAAAPGAAARVGRFELRRELGRGAQATVWLGFDARLEREVAVKLMHPDAAIDPVAVGHWLQEARNSSRLAHPHIVPVFEADLHGRQPYLVFEYVAGPTLAQHLAARGAMPAHEAVAMMVGVLEGLGAAHAAGIVHRDLKPSNVLVDAAGRARVMDFGIAARLSDTDIADQVVGTPGYMSPEAAAGGAPSAAMDVFAAGLVLVEMMCGHRVVAERDPYRAIARVVDADLALPETLPAEVDDALRAVLRRAIERDPARRWPDAAAFRTALQAWLAPPAAPADPAAVAGTLDFLLRRMRHKSDFPALSDSVARIQRVTTSDNESVGHLAGEILKDVALTNKLLRLVNTAHYSSAGGKVSTVSRAISLIGFAGVRNLAISLVLLEHMHDKAHANRLKEDFLRSLMAGMLAGELGEAQGGREEAFIGAMFQNLGRLLAEFYFPEEAMQVRGRLAARPAVATEDAAAFDVLGLGYEDLGLGVAKRWGLPESLQHSMRRPVGDPPARELKDGAERLRWACGAANRITDAILQAEPQHARARTAEIARVFARPLGTSVAQIEAATEVAQQRLVQLARAMNLSFGPQSVSRRLLATVGPETTLAEPSPDSLTPHHLQATITAIDAPTVRTTPHDAVDVLAAGVQDITTSMVEECRLNEVLRMVLETMYRGLGFRRVVFCLRDAKRDALTGRFGIGDGADAVAASFLVALKGPPDLFTAVCLKGADTVIADAAAGTLQTRLPAWYRTGVAAPTFLLLPMMLKGAPFALIYADKAAPGAIELGEKELSLLRTLRNQAVMAFRQTR